MEVLCVPLQTVMQKAKNALFLQHEKSSRQNLLRQRRSQVQKLFVSRQQCLVSTFCTITKKTTYIFIFNFNSTALSLSLGRRKVIGLAFASL